MREGFEVLVAGDGDSALQMVAGHHPDLVLLDVMMPSAVATKCPNCSRPMQTNGGN